MYVFDRLSQPARHDLTQVNCLACFCLMQLNVGFVARSYHVQNNAKPEATMLEFYEPGAAIIEDSVAKTVARLTKTNNSALDFMFGAQKVMLEEIAFVSNEMFDRTRPE